MNFNKAGKYLSLALLVLAIFSISVGISVAAGENSSSTQTVDFNNYISYSNSSNAVNVDYKSAPNLENNLTNSNFNASEITSGFTSGISFNLNNRTDSSDEDSLYDIFALSNENSLSTNVSHVLNCKFGSIQTNVSQVLSEQLFNTSSLLTNTNSTLNFAEGNINQLNENLSKVLDDKLIGLNNSNGLYKNFIFTNVDFDSAFLNLLAHYNKIINTGSESFIIKKNKSGNELNISSSNNKLDTFSFNRNWDELIELEFGSHKLMASKLLVSNYLKAYNILNKNAKKISNFGYFNKNLLDNFSTVDLYKNKYTFINNVNKNQIIKNNNSYFYIFNNSKNNSKIYTNKLSTPENYSSDNSDSDEPSDSINLCNRFIFYFNSFETSNEFYKILGNTKFYGNLTNLTPLKTSIFDILESYSTNTDYFSNDIVSFEIVDIRNDSINFGIITDYSNLLNSNLLKFLNNHVINQDYFNGFNDLGIIVYYNIFTINYNFNTQTKTLLNLVYGIVDMEVSYNDK
ncbi:hypothetical protein [Methanobrevibacter curvatus]|uniref:Uncharacterized protein n=1 Tax=Methanobrevibacter curvatus TaxID=49547 RepID=A0A166DCV4_9EURY|nr:hypothetical protein [Methanobrevibacter curvatus]KZX15453.1 hypothetical protein MBCUR_02610 [Methanobrevibacter curvatus]